MPTESYIGRLAPSPTGLLHLGHARTFWLAQKRAQAAGGDLTLRNEDLDLSRCRPEFSEAFREDLHWLGIFWSYELKQSSRLLAYMGALHKLLELGLIYPCTCSRKDLQHAVAAPHDDTDDEPIYPGLCRPQSPQPDTFRTGTNYRFRIPATDAVHFIDQNAGPQTFTPETDFGDFLVWRKDGLPSYQLACVVDDAFQRITEVVRGRDLLKSTARQILLQRALELPTPQYFHADLVRDDHGVRLAKRHDALSIRSLRHSGLTPADVRDLF
jgi:glutamyl-tRNA synthetase